MNEYVYDAVLDDYPHIQVHELQQAIRAACKTFWHAHPESGPAQDFIETHKPCGDATDE